VSKEPFGLGVTVHPNVRPDRHQIERLDFERRNWTEVQLRICPFISDFWQRVRLELRWTNPFIRPSLAELPVLELVSATHIVADLTLGLGKVAHDCLAPPESSHRKGRRYELAE